MTRPALLACRPVELDLNNEFDRMAGQMTFVYDGAVQGGQVVSAAVPAGRG